jgi:hypothetical protein
MVYKNEISGRQERHKENRTNIEKKSICEGNKRREGKEQIMRKEFKDVKKKHI